MTVYASSRIQFLIIHLESFYEWFGIKKEIDVVGRYYEFSWYYLLILSFL
jgi:hypothetical protein